MKQNASVYDTINIADTTKKSVNFLYNTVPGRVLLRLLIKTTISKTAGLIMSSPVSSLFIKGFIKRNNINMDEYKDEMYRSFNDFFIRESSEGFRSFPGCDNDLASPCDGKLTAYSVSTDSVFDIKNSKYSIEDLLQNRELAGEYSGGICLIFRLTPDDYHRYAFIDDGEVVTRKIIKGKLHTVQPIACQVIDVHCQNSREYVVLETVNFGKIIQLEVGALFVGKITNHNQNRIVKRGDEKGMFQFGGSTIIMLFKDKTIVLDEAIYKNTFDDIETIVTMGCRIGEKA